MNDTLQTGPFALTSPAAIAGFWQAFGSAARILEPAARNVMQAQYEMLSLAGVRSRAWWELPAMVGSCRSPQDLATAQLQFWEKARQDYLKAAERVGETWRQSMAIASSEIEASAAEARDYITFPELRTDETSPGEPRRPTKRKAA